MNKEEKEAKESAMKDIAKVNDKDVIKAIKEGNISKALSSFKTLHKEGKERSSLLYKDAIYLHLNAKQRKALRQKVRKKRNAFAKDIISLKEAKDMKERKILIKTFISFYKTFYKVNDMSLSSLSAKNNDDDTSLLLNEMLKVIKKDKIKA